MKFSAARTTLLAFALTVAIPAVAWASTPDDGEGLLGETDDKLVTFFSLGVLVFFVVVVFIGSAIQSALERRKEQAKAARLRQRTGW